MKNKIDLSKNIKIVNEFIRLKIGINAGVPDSEETIMQKILFWHLQKYANDKKTSEVHRESLENFFKDLISILPNNADRETWLEMYKEA